MTPLFKKTQVSPRISRHVTFLQKKHQKNLLLWKFLSPEHFPRHCIIEMRYAVWNRYTTVYMLHTKHLNWPMTSVVNTDAVATLKSILEVIITHFRFFLNKCIIAFTCSFSKVIISSHFHFQFPLPTAHFLAASSWKSTASLVPRNARLVLAWQPSSLSAWALTAAD